VADTRPQSHQRSASPEVDTLYDLFVHRKFTRAQWPAMNATTAVPGSAPRRRAYWTRQLHQWHWISSAICLVAMLLFSVTGITLNHAAEIEAAPVVTTHTATVPEAVRAQLASHDQTGTGLLPAALSDWLEIELGVDVRARAPEWSESEVYVALPEPGGDAWLTIDRTTGAVVYEHTSRGWISYLNDLHKGRNTGDAWRWFIDVFAVASFVFCITGLCLLQLHSGRRPSTWPIVGFGFGAMFLIALLFIH